MVPGGEADRLGTSMPRRLHRWVARVSAVHLACGASVEIPVVVPVGPRTEIRPRRWRHTKSRTRRKTKGKSSRKRGSTATLQFATTRASYWGTSMSGKTCSRAFASWALSNGIKKERLALISACFVCFSLLISHFRLNNKQPKFGELAQVILTLKSRAICTPK